RVRGALMAAIHSETNNIEGFPAFFAAGSDADRLAEPAVQSAVDAREEACRQALVVLQHDELVREASEFRSHGLLIPALRQWFNMNAYSGGKARQQKRRPQGRLFV